MKELLDRLEQWRDSSYGRGCFIGKRMLHEDLEEAIKLIEKLVKEEHGRGSS